MSGGGNGSVRRSRRKSHCALILEILQDRKPHTHQELYAIGCVLHSRISDLRKRGYTIDQHKDGDSYVYQLTAAAPALSQPEEKNGSAAESLPLPSSGSESAPRVLNAQHEEGPPARGGSSESDEDELGTPEPGSWFADRAPASTMPEVAGSTPAPRPPSPHGVAEVISLLERRGFLEATDERIADLEPDPDQTSLFDEYEEVA